MKIFSTLLLIIATNPAFAGQGVFGSWKFLSFGNDQIRGESVLTIAKDSVTHTVTCFSNGQSVTVTATVSAIVTDSQLQILGNSHDSKSLNGLKCNADIQQGSLSLNVSSDDQSLTVQAPGLQPLTVSRLQ